MGRILLSICAVVVAVGLGGTQAVQPPQQPASANQASEAAENGRQQRAPVMSALSEPKGQSEDGQQQTEPDAGRSEPSPWYDLWAQSLMALWAFLQLVLTGVGIWYIRKTLVETERAVGEAARATKAAQDAVRVSEVSAEKQLRAYMGLDSIGIAMDEGGGRHLAVRWKNFGQTPANAFLVRLFDATPLPDGQLGEKAIDLIGEFWVGQVPPSQVVTKSVRLLGEVLEDAEFEKRTLHWSAQWEYIDIFKNHRVCSAMLSCEPEQLKRSEVGVVGINAEWTVGKVADDWQNKIDASTAKPSA